MTDSTSPIATQVPLIEQLRSVPKDARHIINTPVSPLISSSRSIPYGRMCHEAADALAASPPAPAAPSIGWVDETMKLVRAFASARADCATSYGPTEYNGAEKRLDAVEHALRSRLASPPGVAAPAESSLHDLIPSSAAEWFSELENPGFASADWRGGWDACCNRIRSLVYERVAAPAIQEDAPDAEQRLRAVLEVVERYLPPDGIPADAAMSEIIGLVDPWPLKGEK